MASKSGKMFKFRGLCYWAQGGMVAIADDKDGSFKYEAPMTMRLRAKAFAEESDYMRRKGGHPTDERRELLRAARDLMEVLQEAEAQGNPLIPHVADQQYRESRRIFCQGNGTRRENTTPAGLILPGGS